jgi:ribosomal protein L31
MKSTPKRRTTETLPQDPAFAEVVKLMALGSDAANRLAEIEAEANRLLLELIDDCRLDYAKCQSALTAAEAALEVHARAHPEWFGKAKSIKTPYGKIAFRTGTSLKVKDDEATVNLLRALEPTLNSKLPEGQEPFVAEDYIRTVEVPNLETLERLPDDSLKLFMVTRVVADSFSFTPAKVEFGQAVSEGDAGKN